MPGKSRPSHKECSKKLREAVRALEEGRRVIIDEERHFTEDMAALGSVSALVHWEKVHLFLHEVEAAGGADCYAGASPPLKCYHGDFRDVELFAFAWESPSEKRRMYLKFGIRLSKKGDPTYLYLNCHEDAPEKKNR